MLPDYFIESWVYSSALSAVERCEEWARKIDLDTTQTACLNAAKAELLQISRSQVSYVHFLPVTRLHYICSARKTWHSARTFARRTPILGMYGRGKWFVFWGIHSSDRETHIKENYQYRYSQDTDGQGTIP